MKKVRVYTTRICGFCTAAKSLLAQNELEYEELDVSNDPRTRAWLVQTTGQRIVPQIFIGETSIGGFRELRALAMKGNLVPMVNGQTNSDT